MKVFPTKKVRELDAFTIEHEPISSINLMERAAYELFRWITSEVSVNEHVLVFAGPGNNGGDGLALARMLYSVGYNVDVYVLSAKSYSNDFTGNYNRLKGLGVSVTELTSVKEFPKIDSNNILVDALFGSGLTRPLEGLAAQLVLYINNLGLKVISIDIPSGLFGDENPYPNTNQVVQATVTLTLQFPKLSFFFAENYKYTGKWKVLPIGLHPEGIKKVDTNYFYIDETEVLKRTKNRETFSHKGTYGHALIAAGSKGMVGAAVLASKAAVCAGAGLVTSVVPGCGYSILQVNVPEALCLADGTDNFLSENIAIGKCNAVCIGSGIGKEQKTLSVLQNLLSSATVPLVVDADALNLISQNKNLLDMIPNNSVITPHPGEFDRLFGEHNSGYERLVTAIKMAEKLGVVIVVKGAYTQVVLPSGQVYFNSTGNPGMATGGSGDVLSGIITSLLAQGYRLEDAAIVGVYVHGAAGDIAAAKLGYQALSAMDIINSLGAAFLQIYQ